MLPSQIIPALPRQKLKYKKSDLRYNNQVAEVLFATSQTALVRFVDSEYVTQWALENCEPVPEEPRPLRVGDKVHLPSWGSNASRFGIITSIMSQQGYDKKEYWVDGDPMDELEEIRHATPEEIVAHFAPNA